MNEAVRFIDTDSLFFIVLFIIPVAARLIYNAHIAKYPVKETDGKLRIAQLVIFAVVVFAINATILNKLYVEFINQASVFEPMSRTLTIVILNIVSSFVYCLIWNFITGAYYSIKNKILGKAGSPTHSAYKSMWQSVFYGNDILDARGNLVMIEQGGMVSIGFLDYYSSRDGEEHAITIQHSESAKKYLERDALVEPDKRIFGTVKHIYNDMDNGYKISFYDMDNYFRHIEENAINPSSPRVSPEAEAGEAVLPSQEPL